MEIHLPPETEAMLRERAAAAGRKVEELAIETIREQLGLAEGASRSTRNHSDWVAALHAWSDSHPRRTQVVDDSRESIYEGRGL